MRNLYTIIKFPNRCVMLEGHWNEEEVNEATLKYYREIEAVINGEDQ